MMAPCIILTAYRTQWLITQWNFTVQWHTYCRRSVLNVTAKCHKICRLLKTFFVVSKVVAVDFLLNVYWMIYRPNVRINRLRNSVTILLSQIFTNIFSAICLYKLHVNVTELTNIYKLQFSFRVILALFIACY